MSLASQRGPSARAPFTTQPQRKRAVSSRTVENEASYSQVLGLDPWDVKRLLVPRRQLSERFFSVCRYYLQVEYPNLTRRQGGNSRGNDGSHIHECDNINKKVMRVL